MDKDYDKFIPPERKEDVEDEPWWNRARPQGQRQAQMHQQQVPQQQYGQAPAQIPQQAQQQFQGQMQGVPALAGVPQGYGYEDDDDGFSPVKIVAIVIAVVAALLIVGVGAAFALSHQGEAQDEEPGITQEDEEAAKQASMVYLTVYADGATEETSSCDIKIYKGDSGEDVAKAVNLKCNERGDVGILDAGTYRVHVDTVPSNADGSTYLAPLFDMTFEVAGDGQDMELTINLDKADNGSEGQAENQDTAADQQQTDGQPADAAAANTGNDSGSSAATQSSSSTAQSHQHNWVAVTTTKHHDAVYRTVNHAAVKERRCICDSCNQDITGNFAQHRNASGHSKYHYEYKVVKEAYSERVLVSAAYDETVTTGYRCSGCGATR